VYPRNPGPLETQLLALSTLAERYEFKAKTFRDGVLNLPPQGRTFELEPGLVITVTSATARVLENGVWCFEVVLSATRDGVPLILNNPFQFVNPPIIDGETNTEDLITVAKRILTDAVKTAEGM
jgi:hypothetical protein